MGLPKVSQPTFDITIPSTNQTVKFRRFVVAEEKALLMAREAEDKTGIADAIVDVVDSCSVEQIDMSGLKPFDLDWMFLRLRSQSVENIVKIKYTEGDKEHEFEINLDDVEMPVVLEQKRTIEVDDDISVVVTYPSIHQMLTITKTLERGETDVSLDDLVVAASILSVVNKDGEDFQADTEEEIFEWINSLPSKPYEEITKFLDGIPELTYTIEFENSKGEPDEVVLSGIYDFFTF